MEHSLRAAQIARALAIIRNRHLGLDGTPERAATLALHHDTSEVLKEFNSEIDRTYHTIHAASREKLLALIPDAPKTACEAFFARCGAMRRISCWAAHPIRFAPIRGASRRGAPAIQGSPRPRRACGRASRASTFRKSATA